MSRIASTFFLLSIGAFGQLFPINPAPTNIDFSQGETGRIPSGWDVPAMVLNAGYSAELRRGDCPDLVETCVLMQAPATVNTVRAAELQQTFPANTYLGKKIRFSAWLRAQGPGRGDVELRMRVDHLGGRVEFFDSVDGPVYSEQTERREVTGFVAPDTSSISIWARFHPQGPVWVFDPLFGIVDDARNKADNDAVRALIRKFADLRNAHDGDAVAALYSESGDWFGRGGVFPGGEPRTHGKKELAALWGKVPGQVARTIESVDFPSDNLAIVHVAVRYEDIGLHHEIFGAVKENGGWHIQVHHTVK